jgi:hypothetical protein
MIMAQAYRYGRRRAAIETDLDKDRFPDRGPWTFAQAMDADFWPE